MTYLSMDQGNDRTLTITASEDLTGSDVYFTARRRRFSAEPVIQKSTDGGINVNGTTASVALDRADTESLGQCILHWEVEVVDTDDDTHTVARGRLAIRRTITDRTPPA